jgi:hypothetical protein
VERLERGGPGTTAIAGKVKVNKSLIVELWQQRGEEEEYVCCRTILSGSVVVIMREPTSPGSSSRREFVTKRLGSQEALETIHCLQEVSSEADETSETGTGGYESLVGSTGEGGWLVGGSGVGSWCYGSDSSGSSVSSVSIEIERSK